MNLDIKKKIIDYDILKNENILILAKNKIIYFILEVNNYKKEKELQLNINSNKFIRIKNTTDNNFILFSENSFYIYNNFTCYEEIKIDFIFSSYDIFLFNNIIIYFSESKNTNTIMYTLNLYDSNNKKLDKIEFKKPIKMILIYNAFKIDEDKILISLHEFGISYKIN